MQYATINHAFTLIHLAGHRAWLSKSDITRAFLCKSCPLIQTSGIYLVFAGKEHIVLKYALPFAAEESRRSLTLFQKPCAGSTTGSLTYSKPSQKRDVSEEKTSGTRTSIEFLGITLDSISFQASMIPGKTQCINLLLSNYLLAERFTKH